jgi:predicted RNA-binding protein with PUA-like domain
MNYWLVKSDPDAYGWTDLVRDATTSWDGIRNYKARNFLREMKTGDLVLFYHSGDEKSVVGAVKILSEPHPDTTSEEDIWSAIDIAPAWTLKSPVMLSRIKAEPSLKDIHLVREGRLSVMPLVKKDFDFIVSLGGGTVRLS